MVTGHMVSTSLDYAIAVTENIRVMHSGRHVTIPTIGTGVEPIQDMTSRQLMVVMD